MKINHYKKQDDGLLINTTEGNMKLIPYDHDIIRVIYTLKDNFSSKESLAVISHPKTDINWSVKEVDNKLLLSTDRLTLSINKDTGAFQYLNSKGELLAQEPIKGGKTLDPVQVYKSVFDKDTEIITDKNVDGMRSHAENIKSVPAYEAYHTKLEFQWSDGEALYGLGCHEEGMMNLRGQHQYLYQQNMKAVVPMLVSTNGYGILVDSYSLMTFRDDAFGSYLWTDVDDEMDYYFINGPEMDDIVSSYRMLTGKAPMFPRWAFGYIQSKERYKTQDELTAVVEEYRERKIPLDLIVLDWQSWVGELWGQKSFDPERFPNPNAMTDTLHAMGARLMVSIWPIMKNNGSNHNEMLEKNYLLGNQATYDAFNPDARQLYWDHSNHGLFSKGVDAWWCDCTEPFEADWVGKVKAEPEERVLINTDESKKYIDPQYINAYSLLHSQGIYEGQRQVTEEKRVVNLTRSSYSGQQRYGAITWSGDTCANWITLKRQISDGLNFCATGVPYWTTDIGAFFVRKEPDLWFYNGDYEEGCNDLGYRELYTRWFQYGAFLPLFRSHGTDTPREVWQFGEPGTMFYDTLVNFDNLRYRLMPYIYSTAAMVTLEDSSMMRPLAFDFRKDSNVHNIGDQYMFGPSIMVCPITTPMYYEANSKVLEGIPKTRDVYLPADSDWYDFWTGKKLEGGQCLAAKAPLEIMPIYVKAGSIVPMGPIVQHTGEALDAPIELRIYAGTDGSFKLYEDEGDNYNYEKGAFSLIDIRWEDTSKTLTLNKRQGSFPGMIEERDFKIVLVNIDKGLGVPESDTSDKLVSYKGETLAVTL